MCLNVIEYNGSKIGGQYGVTINGVMVLLELPRQLCSQLNEVSLIRSEATKS